MSANVTLVGRIGKRGELKISTNNTQHLGFTIATSRWKPGRNGEEGTDITTWWHCRIFGARAESLSKRLFIGDLVEVRGETWDEAYTTAAGDARVSHEVAADNVQRLAPGKAASAQDHPAADVAAPAAAPAPASVRDENPPF